MTFARPSTAPCIIGLTGSIAAGKSTVAALLKRRGYPVLCADTIAHDVSRKGGAAYAKIVKAFGRGILKLGGEIDRARLGRSVFTDAKLKKKLERLVHPLVAREFARRTRKLVAQGHRLIFWDVPLLFESGFDAFCDKTLCVTATRADQISRLAKRGLSRADAVARIRAQMPQREKARRADFVLKNDGDKRRLAKKLDALLRRLLPPAIAPSRRARHI